jgi:hypothetical protein
MRDDSTYWWVGKCDGDCLWEIAQRGDENYHEWEWRQRVSLKRSHAEHVCNVYNRKVEARRLRNR